MHSAERVAEAEAQRIANVAAGREATLPDDGAEDRARARQTLEAKLADATRALTILQGERDKAKSALAAASWNVDAAIGALFRERAELIATELFAAECIARDLRLQLVGIADQWMPHAGRPAPIRLGTRAARAINSLPLNDEPAEDHPGAY